MREGVVRVLLSNLFAAASGALAMNMGFSTVSEKILFTGSSIACLACLVVLSGLKVRRYGYQFAASEG